MHYDLLDLYNACAGMQVDFIANLAAGALSVRDIIIDTIKDAKGYTAVLDRPEFYSKVVGLWQSVTGVPPRSEHSEFSKRKAFWLTMYAGREWPDGIVREKMYQAV